MKKTRNRGGIVTALIFIIGLLTAGGVSFLHNSSGAGNSAAIGQSAIVSTPSIAMSPNDLLVTQIKGLSDQISAGNKAYAKSTSPIDNIQLTQDLLSKAKHRKELMKQLMKSDPRLFNALAITSDGKAALPVAIQPEIEQFVNVTGKIAVMHVDDFANEGNDHFAYFIQTPQTQYSFYPTSDIALLSGTTVNVSGYAIDDQLSANVDQNPPAQVGATPAFDSVGNQRVLVVLVKSLPTDLAPFTPAQGQGLVFNSQFQKFMQEQSYGKVSFSGDVFGWLTLGRTVLNGCNLPDRQIITDAVNTYSLNLANYDRLVFLYTGTTGGCSFIGKTPITINGQNFNVSQSSIGLNKYNLPSDGGPQLFPWTNLDHALAHEMGHALGTMHANGWLCTDGNILYGACSHVEYGNYFDTMGSAGYALDYNAYFKEQLGWIPETQVISINQTGSYTLHPQELPNGNTLAKVYTADGTKIPYFIEFRKGLGFDSGLNRDVLNNNETGIFIDRIQSGNSPTSELLDMSPPPPSKPWVPSLQVSTLNLPAANLSVNSFVDDPNGISIGPVTNVSSTSITFNVGIRPLPCQRLAPSLGSSAYSNNIAAGGTGHINILITNNDFASCGPSNFNIIDTAPIAWQYSLSPAGGIQIAPAGNQGNETLIFNIPNGTSPGNYMLTIDVMNTSTGQKYPMAFPITVIEPMNISDLYISSDKTTAYYGDIATLSLGAPTDAVTSNLTILCPSVVIVSNALDPNNANICGLNQRFTPPLPSIFRIKIMDTSKLDQQVTLLYSASNADPNPITISKAISIKALSILSRPGRLIKPPAPGVQVAPDANPDQIQQTNPSPTITPTPTYSPYATPRPVSIDPTNFWAAALSAFIGI